MLQALIPFDTPLEDETQLSWEYFQLYRDMGPERTKVAVAEIEVEGKTRDATQIGRWAKKFRWDFRAHAYDMAKLQESHEKAVLKREEDLTQFIDDDIDYARMMQQIAIKMMKQLEKAVEQGEGEIVDLSREYRALALGYQEVRKWVKDHLVFTYGHGRIPGQQQENNS